MESQFGRRNGQAIVESIFGITLVTLFISLAVSLVFEMRDHFKHDYLASESASILNPNSEKSTESTAPIDRLSERIIFFSNGPQNKNLHHLNEDGWTVQKSFKLNDQLYYILDKDGRQMVFSNNLGVKLCTDDCSTY